MKCFLCKEAAVESLEFEAGNNAELGVSVQVCQSHLDEYDQDEYKFQDKYGEQIDNHAYEDLISNAEMLRDQMEGR